MACEKETYITAFYARCSAIERLEIRKDFRDIAEEISKPCIVEGYFNVIMSDSEKLGGLPVTQHEIINFAQCINVCELSEIKSTENLYTWWNSRIEDTCTFKS